MDDIEKMMIPTQEEIDNCTPVVEKSEEPLFNGMVNVPNLRINYRGFTIQPKLDMGKTPWRSHANDIRTGWVVVRRGCNALPGATWCSSPFDAKATIDLWIEAGFNGEKFWEMMRPYMY